MTNTIITIGRQYGSGGRYVARLLAEKLEIPFYDKELLTEVARDSGMSKELLEEHDERTTVASSSPSWAASSRRETREECSWICP